MFSGYSRKCFMGQVLNAKCQMLVFLVPFVPKRSFAALRMIAAGLRRPAKRDHIMAVGGAGSSGRPALARGTLIMTVMRMANAINPEIQCGLAKIWGREWP